MPTIAESIYSAADIGTIITLPKAGTRLENRYVFDSSAREITAMAERGLVKVVSESHASDRDDALITDIAFVRMR
jgi:hypothetical protein